MAQVDAGAELETGTEATTLSTILPPGSIIDGRYEIVDKLAAGGMGEVYKALHVELGKPMALKVMLPELSADREFVARFKREAIAASRIGQQNIIDVSDFGQTPNGRFYFVMEFLDGLTLASVSHREGALSAQRAVAITAQVARALAAAHAQGIVHRDLKPENIMLLQRPGQRDFVKVLDFGVAKVATGRGEGGHTAVGMVVGTPQYMSPEQARAVPVDARSDIYALGLILYELLAGRPTFSAETPSMLMVKHVTEPPPPLPPGDTPVELSELIFQMLEKDPDARPQTMEAVLEVLDMLEARLKANDPQLKRLSGDYVRAATPTKTAGVGLPRATGTTPGVASAAAVPPSRSRVPALLFGIVAVLALALVAVVAIDRDTPEPLVVEKRVVVEKPGSPPPIEKVKLIFAAQPEIVEVYEDDVLLGTTPYTAVREAGAVAELTFVAKGYMPLMRKVKFETEQLLTVTLEKEKKAGPSPSPKKQPKENPGAIKDLKDAPF